MVNLEMVVVAKVDVPVTFNVPERMVLPETFKVPRLEMPVDEIFVKVDVPVTVKAVAVVVTRVEVPEILSVPYIT